MGAAIPGAQRESGWVAKWLQTAGEGAPGSGLYSQGSPCSECWLQGAGGVGNMTGRGAGVRDGGSRAGPWGL